ncbi:baseplate J/gp47 family protein [Lachnospiraceae bacterium ZAX-1]
MPYPFVPPDFLQGQSADEIHKRMMDALPSDIDKSAGQTPWDYTRPSALEKAEFVEFELNEAIKNIFPHWAYGEWLDLHAQGDGLVRRPANKAYGILTVRASEGTIIPKGFQFATPAQLSPSILFETIQEATFSGVPEGDVWIEKEIPIQAVEAGIGGNAAPGTIKLMVKPISGISYISNENAVTGGAPPEDDESLRERILSMVRLGMSYVGCDADYVRWAQEIQGVGNVSIVPEWDGPGTVKLVILDANGNPANEQILDAVYGHIVSPDDRLSRLAPIGATVTVSAPTTVTIDISAAVSLKEGENIDTVKERFENSLLPYWAVAASDTSVKYVFVGAILAGTQGVKNYSQLTINGGTSDVGIEVGQFPMLGEVVFDG